MEIITKKIIKPPRLLIYGVGGIGKTSFMAGLPSPIISDIEGGADQLDVARFGEIKDLKTLQSQIEWLCKEPHDFKSYVIDSADWLEKLITEHITKNYDEKELSYGRGNQLIREELGKILAGLDWLRNYKNMIIGFTAHAKIKEFKDPMSDNYDIYTLNCRDEKFASIIIEWCDIVGFANYRYTVVAESESFGKKLTKAKGGDERVLYVTNKASFVAKNRYSIKEHLQLDANKVLNAIGFDSNKKEGK